MFHVKRFALALCGLLPGLAWAAIEEVRIPGGNVELVARIYRPDGAGPFPAIVMMHGCSGMWLRDGVTPTANYRSWAEHFQSHGYVAMLLDSFGSRGEREICTQKNRKISEARERPQDAYAALRWLAARKEVDATHIHLMGWSNGAMAVLQALRADAPDRPAGKEPGFRSAVALYPGCRRLGNAAWSARVPTLILIGRADDQASAATCQQMVAGARGRSARVEIHVYPNAHHDFDHPNRPLQVRTGLAFSVDGSGRVHSGTNPAARADALKRVPEWFSR